MLPKYSLLSYFNYNSSKGTSKLERLATSTLDNGLCQMHTSITSLYNLKSFYSSSTIVLQSAKMEKKKLEYKID